MDSQACILYWGGLTVGFCAMEEQCQVKFRELGAGGMEWEYQHSFHSLAVEPTSLLRMYHCVPGSSMVLPVVKITMTCMWFGAPNTVYIALYTTWKQSARCALWHTSIYTLKYTSDCTGLYIPIYLNTHSQLLLIAYSQPVWHTLPCKLSRSSK